MTTPNTYRLTLYVYADLPEEGSHCDFSGKTSVVFCAASDDEAQRTAETSKLAILQALEFTGFYDEVPPHVAGGFERIA